MNSSCQRRDQLDPPDAQHERCALATMLGFALVLACCAGCDAFDHWTSMVDDDSSTALPTPSRAVFGEAAGPILEARCADFACHGNDVQPFGLYAVARRRLSAADTFTAKPLTTAEVDANYDATLGFLDASRARDTTLIHKALGIGGVGGHHGGAVFEAPSDPACRTLMAWIDGTTAYLGRRKPGAADAGADDGGRP